MNTLDQLEADENLAWSDDLATTVSTIALQQLLDVARKAQAIDLREQDIPVGPTRVAIHELHLALAPLLEELDP